MEDTASRTNPFVPRTHSHPRERFQPPGVPNHYLTFITSYERRNFVGARFSHGTTALRDHPPSPLHLARFYEISYSLVTREFKVTTCWSLSFSKWNAAKSCFAMQGSETVSGFLPFCCKFCAYWTLYYTSIQRTYTYIPWGKRLQFGIWRCSVITIVIVWSNCYRWKINTTAISYISGGSRLKSK